LSALTEHNIAHRFTKVSQKAQTAGISKEYFAPRALADFLAPEMNGHGRRNLLMREKPCEDSFADTVREQLFQLDIVDETAAFHPFQGLSSTPGNIEPQATGEAPKIFAIPHRKCMYACRRRSRYEKTARR
jgi:hypothetical protein